MGDEGRQDALPVITALFLVVFDQRVGYKIAWQRSQGGAKLEGVVEYKSLPSGLHHVSQDLVYFTHGDHAGLSAFRNKPAEESDRRAQFVAVGVLVPLSYGRLGRAWMHAEGLRRLAETCTHDATDYPELERYWDKHGSSRPEEEAQSSVILEPSTPGPSIMPLSKAGKRRSRALSDAAGFSLREHVLSSDHPALSIPECLDVFGPLIFPLYRAALLRKRMLLLGSAPVQQACNYVYDFSIFSNLPGVLSDVPTSSTTARLRPLFNIGIHDISELMDLARSGGSDGWIACTTDDIFGSKKQLYDVLVDLNVDQHPRIISAEGTPILATHRDLRRYRALQHELSRLDRALGYSDDEDDSTALLQSTTSLPSIPGGYKSSGDQGDHDSGLIEPSTWTSIAYSSFLWWASAGESSTSLLDDERQQDSELFSDLIQSTGLEMPSSSRAGNGTKADQTKKSKRSSTTSLGRLLTGDDDDSQSRPRSNEERQRFAMVLVAVFHRMTVQLLVGLKDILDREEGEGYRDENDDAPPESSPDVKLDADDVRRLGLDLWSESDARFIAELGQTWFGRKVIWDGNGIECCGVRIC